MDAYKYVIYNSQRESLFLGYSEEELVPCWKHRYLCYGERFALTPDEAKFFNTSKEAKKALSHLISFIKESEKDYRGNGLQSYLDEMIIVEVKEIKTYKLIRFFNREE
jgi:hypothetical protein